MPDSEKILEEYRKIPTGTISDALDALKIPSGVIVGGPRALNAHVGRMAGYAYTMQQMPKRQLHPGKVRQIEVYNHLAQSGNVVVIDAGGRLDAATTGGLQVIRAKVRGLSGIVLNGCCRDADEIVEQDFPFFCCGTSPRKSVPLETVGVNVPITISNIQICPGDLIVGDATGLVVVPAEECENVLKKAQYIQKVEQHMEECLLSGGDYMGLRDRIQQEIPE